MTPPPPPPGAVEVEAVTDTTGLTLPNPLQTPMRINDIAGRRKKTDKAQWGTAALATSDQFHSYEHAHKPKAKCWDHRFNLECRSRQGNSLKQAARFLGKAGLISLGGGLPSSEYFPYDSLELTVPTAPLFSEADTKAHGAILHAGKHDLAEDKAIFDISTAFNYGQGSGSAQLLRWITEHTELCHNPPYADWQCNMTIGSTSALDMALRMFTERGDYILSEEYTFATAVETAAPMGVKVAGIKMDAEGLLPSSLDHILSTWDPAQHQGARKPFLLYTVPSGQNPTGATQSAARRRHMYALAQKHDLYILEDEPYYFLQMAPYVAASASSTPAQPRTHADFLASLVPSLLSMDTDGRVMRLDSFSKVISPGSRIGWITASAAVIDKYRMHADVSTQGPSGMAQLLVFKLLDEHWGHAGYMDWLMHIRREYTGRRDVILAACERHLPADLVSWVPPMAGMFHWLRVDWRRHPDAATKSLLEIEEDIFLRTVDHGALVMRGSWFYANADEGGHESMFFRATYAAAPAGRIDEAIRRFGEAVRESFGREKGGVEGGALERS